MIKAADEINPEDEIKAEVSEVLQLEQSIKETEALLAKNPEFQNFIEMQKEFTNKSALVWAHVEATMINQGIKSIKIPDLVTLTIAERTGFDINMDELPKKFIKKVADTKKIGDTYKLEGTPPKGCTPKVTHYLTKRFK